VIIVISLLWSLDGGDRTLDRRAQRESDDAICDSVVCGVAR
jgi:hypothetical protein